jgi:DNA-binding MarR family transcriptional regulator
MPRKTMETAVGDLSHAIGLLVRRVRAAAPSGELSWTETAVLNRLAQDGPATTADLARAQGMRPQSMRTIVASLEELGMVARKPHPTDGRQVNLELTARGAAAQKSASDAAGRIIRRLVENDRA